MTKAELKAAQKAKRLENANEILMVISGCGRRFFYHEGRVSKFELDANGRVWFVDKYSQKRIYTHYKYKWRGFTNGGTLRGLCECLRDYISKGKPLPAVFGPWPEWLCGGDLWGYGADIQIVRDAAERLGLHGESKHD